MPAARSSTRPSAAPRGRGSGERAGKATQHTPDEQDLPAEARKQPRCAHFSKTGQCRYGERCRFSHDRVDSGKSLVTRQEAVEVTREALLNNHQLLTFERHGISGALMWSSDKVTSCDSSACVWLWSLRGRMMSARGAEALLGEKENDLPKALGRLSGADFTTRRRVRKGRGSISDPLSFQRVFGLLVHVVSGDSLGRLGVSRAVNQLIGPLVETMPIMMATFIGCTQELLERDSLGWEENFPGFQPTSFAQLFLPFLSLMEYLLPKFSTVATNRVISQGMEAMKTLLGTWESKMKQQRLDTVEDAAAIKLASSSHERGMRSFLNYMDLNDILAKRKKLEREVSDRAEVAGVWRDSIEPPPEGHPYDHAAFREIGILPCEAEILSDEPPVLPGNWAFDPNCHWLPPGPERLLDTHFRLLRYEMLEDFKISIKAVHGLFQRSNQLQLPEIFRQGGRFVTKGQQTVDVDIFPARLETYSGTSKHGVSEVVNFQLPPAALKRPKIFFEKRLRTGALVCLLSRNGLQFRQIAEDATSVEQPSSTAHGRIHLTSGCMDSNRQELPGNVFYIIESRKLLYESFRPILKALQGTRPSDIPFSCLCPEEPATQAILPQPPLYGLGEAFYFDLTRFLDPNSPQLWLFPAQPESFDEVVERLDRESSFDRSQAKAFVAALTQHVCCIQGPPGCGKSFVGVRLLEALYHQSQAVVFPILVVCYTNHALDQFLEEIVSHGITSIARLGSRSKCTEVMKGYIPYLWADKRKIAEIKEEEAEVGRLSESLEALRKEDVGALDSRDTWRYFRRVFRDEAEQIQLVFSFFAPGMSHLRSWISGRDLEERERGRLRRNQFDALSNIEDGGESPAEEVNGSDSEDRSGGGSDTSEDREMGTYGNDLKDVQLPVPRFWSESLEERKAVWREMLEELQNHRSRHIRWLEAEIDQRITRLEDLHNERILSALRPKKILGLTTTGAAKFQGVLRRLKPKVLIVEEAGEVLESHILSLLHSQLRHLLLIGDHLQLVPKVDRYELTRACSQKYRLDLSLFERLITPESGGHSQLPLHTLNCQRRMAPIISQFIRETGIYPTLLDGENTLGREDIKGISKSVFFLDHEYPEECNAEEWVAGISHKNDFEAKMAVALVKHLMLQGYSAGQIAIITPYLGQLKLIMSRLADERVSVLLDERDEMLLELAALGVAEASGKSVVQDVVLRDAIRTCTIDNFQGEEAHIVIISLTRSQFKDGTEGGIGFMRNANRINVLLSRARNGLYLIGNARLYRKRSKMWDAVFKMMGQQGLIGRAIPVHCQTHPKNTAAVSEPDGFKQFCPDGGCQEPCFGKLGCGHACPRKCHPDDQRHIKVRCTRDCPRLLDPCGHPCPKLCFERCGPCMKDVAGFQLKCGHMFRNPKCYQSHDRDGIRCNQAVQKLRWCGHQLQAACCREPDEIFCHSPCAAPLPCGHSCHRLCSQCRRKDEADALKTDHGECGQKCGRKLQCLHLCTTTCARHPSKTEACPPCRQPCDRSACDHSRCRLDCGEMCVPCVERCLWHCKHRGGCDLPCGAPCLRDPCDLRCQEALACGHQCPGICGDICPSVEYCQICAGADVKEQMVDFITMETYADIELDKNPVVVLKCGHILTMQTLDGHIGMEHYYVRQADGWKGVQDLNLVEETWRAPKACPHCRHPIRSVDSRRYGRPIKSAMLTIADKYFLRKFNESMRERESELKALSAKLPALQSEDAFNKMAEQITLLFKGLKNNPNRKLHDACIRVLNGHRGDKKGDLEHRLRLTGFLRQYLVEEGKAHLLECKIMRRRIDSRRKVGADWKPSLLEQALKACRSARNCFERGKAYYWVGASWMEELFLRNCEIGSLCELRLSERFLRLRNKAAWIENALTKVNQARQLHKQASERLRDLPGTEERAADLDVLQENFNKAIEAVEHGGRLTSVEWAEVKMAMELGEGHWYSCPNGHVYVIGDCGGAVETGHCNECGAEIGGQGYMLAGGNQGIQSADLQ